MRAQNLNILNNAFTNDGTFMQYKGFWKFNSTGSGPYLHMKTNINTVNNMWCFDAVGYNYGDSHAIRCTWVVHKSGGGLYYVGGGNLYFGMYNDGCYLSGDGYIVLRAYAGSYFYIGFMLNAYNTADVYDQSGLGNNKTPEILAAALSGSSSPIY